MSKDLNHRVTGSHIKNVARKSRESNNSFRRVNFHVFLFQILGWAHIVEHLVANETYMRYANLTLQKSDDIKICK